MYDLGDPVPLAVDVFNAAGALANATAITLTITLPDGTVATPTVTNPPAVTGRYTYEYPTVQAGRHTIRWVSTTPSAAFTDAFDVDEAASTAIVNLVDVKAHLGLIDTTHDERLRLFIDAATDVVERYVGPVVKRTVVERVRAFGQVMVLNHTPVVSVTSIAAAVTGGTTYAVADLSLNAAAGLLYRLDGGSFAAVLDVTIVAGRTIVPPALRLATMEQIRVMWQKSQGGLPASAGFDDSEPMPPSSEFFRLIAPFRLGPGIA